MSCLSFLFPILSFSLDDFLNVSGLFKIILFFIKFSFVLLRFDFFKSYFLSLLTHGQCETLQSCLTTTPKIKRSLWPSHRIIPNSTQIVFLHFVPAVSRMWNESWRWRRTDSSFKYMLCNANAPKGIHQNGHNANLLSIWEHVKSCFDAQLTFQECDRPAIKFICARIMSISIHLQLLFSFRRRNIPSTIVITVYRNVIIPYIIEIENLE